MTRTELAQRASQHRSVAASSVVWNTVMPALGLALILGAAVLPALAIAGTAAAMIHVVLGGEQRGRRQRRPWASAHVAPGHVVRGM